MKLIIDTDILEKENIPIDVAASLLALYIHPGITYNTFESLCARGYITYTGFNRVREPVGVLLTQTGINIIEKILINSEFEKTPTKNNKLFEEIAKAMQELYPKGTKEGTNLKWQDSTPIIADRLKKLVKKYNVEFTKEEAVDATKRYVESFGSNLTFMQVLKY